jgi:ABC-type sugar transport system ATPase subunit
MLEVRGLSKSFGSIRVIENISLAFEPGTVTAIVGDNGAGKSTLLKLVAGVHVPDAGSVILNEGPLNRPSPRLHRSAGIEMVYQDLALAKNHDVMTNLFIGREPTCGVGILDRGRMRRRAAEIIDALGITIADPSMRVGTLSGGQQQAIAIARALLFDPKVLLFDEPTAALAAREIERFIELVKSQRDQGRITILVSHRMNDVFAVADRIVVLKRGLVYSDDHAHSLTIADVVERIVS